MRTKQIKLLKSLIALVLILTISMNVLAIENRNNTIYIGTKNLTEQRIIANIYKVIIEDKTDYDVKIVNGLDTSSFINSALENGDIDMYVEYTSTAYLELFGHEYNQQTKSEIYNTLIKDYQNEGINLHSKLGFENSNAIICNSFCNDIDEISDLDGQKFTFAAPAYFFERSDGYNLLEDQYDLSNVEIVKADPVIIYSGIISGQIDVGLGFTTDAKLARTDIKVLKDTDLVFPSYEAILVTNEDLEKRFPGINNVLKTLEGNISTNSVQMMNDAVENKKISIEETAKKYVKDNIKE